MSSSLCLVPYSCVLQIDDEFPVNLDDLTVIYRRVIGLVTGATDLGYNEQFTKVPRGSL